MSCRRSCTGNDRREMPGDIVPMEGRSVRPRPPPAFACTRLPMRITSRRSGTRTGHGSLAFPALLPPVGADFPCASFRGSLKWLSCTVLRLTGGDFRWRNPVKALGCGGNLHRSEHRTRNEGDAGVRHPITTRRKRDGRLHRYGYGTKRDA